MRRYRALTMFGVGLLSLVVGVALVSPLGEAIADLSSNSVPSAVPGPGDGDDRSSGVTAVNLSILQREDAIAIARTAPAVRTFFDDPTASIVVVPWTTMKTRELLGAGIDLSWTTPRSADAEWPTMIYDETETASPPYQSTTAKIQIKQLTGVHVAVDLRTRRIVGVPPLPGATVTDFKLDPSYRDQLPPQPKTPR